MATCASIRCRPHSFITLPPATTSPGISSVRGSDGLPLVVIARYEPASLLTHSPVSNPGKLTNGVSIFAPVAQGLGCAASVLTPLEPVERYACMSALPPFNAAGLMHAA